MVQQPDLVPPRLAAGLMVLALLTGVAGGTGPADVPPVGLAGRPLAEALDALAARGLAVVYSDALVRPEMVVEREPAASEPRAVLDELLAAHGLVVQEATEGRLVVVRAAAARPLAGSIVGSVAAADRRHLGRVVIRVTETGRVTGVDEHGGFALAELAPGVYTVEAESPAFLPYRVAGVEVVAGGVTSLRLELASAAAFLDAIVVTPSHFRLLDLEPEERQFLSREEVVAMPHLADDLFRAVRQLPGASGGDFSAELNVRGGVSDEVLVVLDGVELFDPFHLKDFQSVFSIVDTAAVGGVDFLAGGFPVEYGDRLSGVMDIDVVTPTGPPSGEVAVGTINARVASAGSFDSDRGQWLVSGRGWYPETVVDLVRGVSEEILSNYWDLFAKLQYRVGEHSTLSADLLTAGDDLAFHAVDDETDEQVKVDDRNHHLWFVLRSDLTPALYSESVLYGATAERSRVGGVDDVEEGTVDVVDRRSFAVAGVKQAWTLRLADRHVLKWGLELRRQRSTYDYARTVVDEEGESEEVIVDLRPDGSSYSLYLSDRLRLGARVVAEAGLRWDKQFWVEDPQLSPRLNLMVELGQHTTLRAAAGRFYQTQRLNELQVEDGVVDFSPAQLAEHFLLGLERRFEPGLVARVEVFRKELDDLHPRFENQYNPMELFPEAQPDRVEVAPDGGRVEGVDVVLKQVRSSRVSWWASYGLARAEDDIDGSRVARSWDQRHTVGAGLDLDLGQGYHLNLVGDYHSGWPITGVTGVVVEGDYGEDEVELVLGPRNGERLPAYLRFDLRASKEWNTRHGSVTLLLDVVNVTDRENVSGVDDFETEITADGRAVVTAVPSTWAPIVPSLGVRWRF